MKNESLLMSFLRSIGLNSKAWSLRRLYCPVDKNDLVLEAGSGGNPYPRANVLCDAYLETGERHFVPLVHDRPTILGFVENLPFKDDSFDFAIASHVLEHSRDPKAFISELQRVAKAGYIETPDAFMERICPYPMHSLEVSDREGIIEIRKKKGQVHDAEVFELFKRKISKIFPKLIKKDPFRFHVRYYWKKDNGGIKYKILNSDYVFDWPVSSDQSQAHKEGWKRAAFLSFARLLFSQNRRNRKIDVESLLKCPSCKIGKIKVTTHSAICTNCNRNYEIIDNKIIDFTKII